MGEKSKRGEMVANLTSRFVLYGSLGHFVKRNVDNDLYAAIDVAIIADIKKLGVTRCEKEIMTICVTDDVTGLNVKSFPAENFPDFRMVEKFRKILINYLCNNAEVFEKTSPLLRRGIEKYVRMLEIYSESRSLLEELRKAESGLDLDDPSVVGKLRAAIHALGETPSSEADLFVIE